MQYDFIYCIQSYVARQEQFAILKIKYFTFPQKIKLIKSLIVRAIRAIRFNTYLPYHYHQNAHNDIL